MGNGENNIAECEGQRFGHNYAGGVCTKCRGFQEPLKGMEKIDRKWKEPKNKSGSARAFLISQFLEEVNKQRDGVKYKKLTPQFLGIKLAHLNYDDLRWYWDACWWEDKEKRKKYFNVVYFWGRLKTDNLTKT